MTATNPGQNSLVVHSVRERTKKKNRTWCPTHDLRSNTQFQPHELPILHTTTQSSLKVWVPSGRSIVARDHIYGDWRWRSMTGTGGLCGWNSVLECMSQVQMLDLGYSVATFRQALKFWNLYKFLTSLQTLCDSIQHGYRSYHHLPQACRLVHML